MANLLIGKKAILENINKNIITSVHGSTFFPNIKKKCDELNIPYIIHHNDGFFDNFTINHQGVIAYLKNDNFLEKDYETFIQKIQNNHKKHKLIIILDSIQDPFNFGNIIRTCECFDVDGIIYKKNNQVQINEFVIKTSVGAIYNTCLLRVNNLSQIIDRLKKDDFWVLATSLDTNNNYLEQDYKKNIALIIGNENKGVCENIKNKADLLIKINMFGSSQSLNVTVATGILISYIKTKQNKDKMNDAT